MENLGRSESSVTEDSVQDKLVKATQFLQSQHESTIRGLHQEIDHLSSQCADLQFQLVFHGVLPSKEELLAAQVASLTRQLQDLTRQLEQQKETAAQLAHDLSQQQERYGEDVSARNLIIVKLRRDVQEKAKRVADLQATATARGTRSDHPTAASASSSTDQCRSAGTVRDGSLYGRLRRSVGGETTPEPAGRAQSFTSGVTRQLVDKYWRSASLPRASSTTSTATSTATDIGCSCAVSTGAGAVESGRGGDQASVDNANVWRASTPHLNS